MAMYRNMVVFKFTVFLFFFVNRKTNVGALAGLGSCKLEVPFGWNIPEESKTPRNFH